MQKRQQNFWNIPPQTGRFLNLLIKDRKYKTVLEIGTSNGYSGIFLAEASKHNNGHLHTIESHKERYKLACENFKKSGLDNYITAILGHAPENIPKKPNFFDMAFFDATKYEHLSYFEAIKNRIKKDGIIVTDNINSHRKELANYIKTAKNTEGWKSYELELGTGLLLSIKVK